MFKAFDRNSDLKVKTFQALDNGLSGFIKSMEMAFQSALKTRKIEFSFTVYDKPSKILQKTPPKDLEIISRIQTP